MSLPSFDWNELYRSVQAEKHEPMRDPNFWDKRAPEFARHAKESDYAVQFMKIMKPEAQWSILDIGCAAGTLAAPLSSTVKSITAMDPSKIMLSLLERRCREEGIENIKTVNAGWQDDWEALGVGIHDVAVASRSLLVDDLRDAVLKLERHARKRVYISTLVDDGPYDRRIVEAVGRNCRIGADYIMVYNLLRQMGFYANVAFTINKQEKSYSDIDDALDSMRWMIPEMTPQEEESLRTHLERSLVRANGCWRLPYSRVVRWAVLWWEKD